MNLGNHGPKLAEVLNGPSIQAPFEAPEAIERRLGVKFRLRLGANESTYGPSRVAQIAVNEAAKSSSFYGDPECRVLRESIASKHRVPIEAVTVAGGIDELLSLFCRAYVNRGEAVVTTHGSYATFEYAARGVGAQIVTVNYRGYAIDPVGLALNANLHNAKIVYVSNPDNPSGSYCSAKALATLRAAIPPDCLLLVDEAYSDFVGQSDASEVAVDDVGVVRLRTFSKAHGLAGLRIGYSLGHPQHYSAINRLRMHFGVSNVSQAAAIASLQNNEHVVSVVAATSFARFKMLEMAARLGIKAVPSRTNFLLLEFGSKERADALLEAFLRDGVFLRKPTQPPLDSCIRVTIGTTVELDSFEEALVRLLPTVQGT